MNGVTRDMAHGVTRDVAHGVTIDVAHAVTHRRASPGFAAGGAQ